MHNGLPPPLAPSSAPMWPLPPNPLLVMPGAGTAAMTTAGDAEGGGGGGGGGGSSGEKVGNGVEGRGGVKEENPQRSEVAAAAQQSIQVRRGKKNPFLPFPQKKNLLELPRRRKSLKFLGLGRAATTGYFPGRT